MRSALLVLVACVACGSSSSNGGAPDGGADSTADATRDGDPFGHDTGSSEDSGDADPCAAMKAMLADLERAARKCRPTDAMPCNGATNGPCCAITVTSANVQAVNDYDQAVMTYTSMCKPDCSIAMCGMVPSGVCDPTSMLCQ